MKGFYYNYLLLLLLQGGRWEYVQPMKTLRRGIAVGVLEGPMYAVGMVY